MLGFYCARYRNYVYIWLQIRTMHQNSEAPTPTHPVTLPSLTHTHTHTHSRARAHEVKAKVMLQLLAVVLGITNLAKLLLGEFEILYVFHFILEWYIKYTTIFVTFNVLYM